MDVVHLIQRKYLTVRSQLKPLDFAKIAQFLTLDVITFLSAGEPLGFVSDDEDKYEYVKSFYEAFPFMNIFASVPILCAITTYPPIQNGLIPTEKDQKGLGRAKA